MRDAKSVLLGMADLDRGLEISLRKLLDRYYTDGEVSADQFAETISNVCDCIAGRTELIELVAEYHDAPELLTMMLDRGLSQPPT